MAVRPIKNNQALHQKNSLPARGGEVYGEVFSFLKEYHLDVRKNIGQNFLIREEPLILACEAADVGPDDFVLEIGPGPGTLTSRLAERAGAVAAIELDGRMARGLQKKFSDNSKITIISGNALETDTQGIYEKYSKGLNFKVVANIPYYITSALLRHYLSNAFKPQIIVMLIQKEVALQATSQKNKSLLSLSVQYYGNADIAGEVPKDCFYPAPKIDSAFLRIRIHNLLPLIVDEDRFFSLARHAFSQSRKTLPNSLSASMSIDKEEIVAILREAGAEFLSIRAGALSLEQWQKLYDTMHGRLLWK